MKPVDLADAAAAGRGLRAAVAGVGHWHFSNDTGYLWLARLCGLEIVGVCDDQPSIARHWADEVGCGWALDVDDLVSRYAPDVVIALPRPDRALEQVGRLLDRGVPVIAEKPLGVSATETWQLVERAERGWVTVAFPQRYLPLWSAFVERRDAGTLGTIAHASVRQINGPPARYRTFGVEWMLDPTIAGGGPLRNIGIHGVDLLVQLLGEQGLRVESASKTDHVYAETIEDYIVAIGRAPGGALVSIETGYTLAGGSPEMDLTIAASGVYLHQRRDHLTILPESAPAETINETTPGNFYDVMFLDALRRLRGGEPPFGTVRDCARANAVIDAIYAAAGGNLTPSPSGAR
jgi:predicted dehydrogenase